MLIIFTGNGKGKTTAAIGQALRAVGNGSRVLMVQFIKGPWKSGEDASVKKFGPNFRIIKKGRGFVRIRGDKIPFSEHVDAACEALAYAEREVALGKWKILVLDEVWNALSLGLISRAAVSNFISENLTRLDHLIMTGRDCPQEFIDMADLVTEMREVKHPFAVGKAGVKTMEY